MNDASFQSIFEPVIQHIMEWYQPSAVVLQCGADSLAGDKLGCFNLSMHGECRRIRQRQKRDKGDMRNGREKWLIDYFLGL